MCKIASILQIPPFRMPLRDEKAKNSPRFSVVRAKTGAVPCFTQLVKAFTLLNTLNFARRRRGYLCPRQDMEAKRQLAGKLVSAAPAFPLPSATLAERMSDRERKGRGEQPTIQSVFALRQDMEAQSGDILGKAAHGVERDLVRVATDVLALGQDAVGYRDDLATAGLGLVDVDKLTRGRP